MIIYLCSYSPINRTKGSQRKIKRLKKNNYQPFFKGAQCIRDAQATGLLSTTSTQRDQKLYSGISSPINFTPKEGGEGGGGGRSPRQDASAAIKPISVLHGT